MSDSKETKDLSEREREEISISVVIHTWIRQSRGLGETQSVGVVITNAPVYIRERRGGRRGGYGLRKTSLLSYTLKYISLTELVSLCQWGL